MNIPHIVSLSPRRAVVSFKWGNSINTNIVPSAFCNTRVVTTHYASPPNQSTTQKPIRNSQPQPPAMLLCTLCKHEREMTPLENVRRGQNVSCKYEHTPCIVPARIRRRIDLSLQPARSQGATHDNRTPASGPPATKTSIYTSTACIYSQGPRSATRLPCTHPRLLKHETLYYRTELHSDTHS